MEERHAPDVDALGAVVELVAPAPEQRHRVLEPVPPVADQLEDQVAQGRSRQRPQGRQIE
jgi:hypothetical protein